MESTANTETKENNKSNTDKNNTRNKSDKQLEYNKEMAAWKKDMEEFFCFWN